MDVINHFDYKNVPIDYYSIGVGNARYNSLLVYDNGTKFLMPAGGSLCAWDISTMKRLKTIRATSNQIFCLGQNAKHIFAMAFNGEICVLDKLELKPVQHI